MPERCVCCGEIIPEGWRYYLNCLVCVGGRSGKTVAMIRRADMHNAAILVGSEARKAQICAVGKALGVDVEQRVFVSARGNDKQTLTMTDIKKAIDLLNNTPPPKRYFFYTRWCGKTLGDDTDAKCIEYFNGTGVVVVDSKGRCWLNKEPYKNGVDADMVALVPKRDCKYNQNKGVRRKLI